MNQINKIYNEDCLEGIKRIPDASIDCILTDPPYLYLKGQKLDRPFDEHALFTEFKAYGIYRSVRSRYVILSLEYHSIRFRT